MQIVEGLLFTLLYCRVKLEEMLSSYIYVFEFISTLKLLNSLK
jgi:hypothetical protein